MLRLLRRACPYPTIDLEGELVDGLVIEQPRACHKCRHQRCRSILASLDAKVLSHAICDEGYSVICIPSECGAIWVNGVLVPFHNTRKDHAWRKANRRQKAPWEAVQAYEQSLALAGDVLQRAIQDKAQEAVAGLHDIKTAVGVVLRNAEAIIRSLPGRDDNEKIEGADPELKSLLKSVSLLESRLKLASLVANPSSARYGELRSTAVYRLFHAMVRLFEQEALRRNVRLRMNGESYNSLLLYDSFDTLPLVLIENAVKYSPRGKEVVVKVVDDGKYACTAQVESWGPVVPVEYRSMIFERGVRGPRATDITPSGSGLGLFIAKIVADANRCELTYRATTRQRDDVEGTNIFSLKIQGVSSGENH